jgi:hypothetical protein
MDIAKQVLHTLSSIATSARRTLAGTCSLIGFTASAVGVKTQDHQISTNLKLRVKLVLGSLQTPAIMES